MSELTWTCHVCGRTRPDAMIGVRTFTFDNGDGIPVSANVRYCRDTPSCYDGAPHVSFVQKLRELWGPTEDGNVSGYIPASGQDSEPWR